MILSLLQFIVLWIIELMIFTSVSILLFGHLPGFSSFFEVMVYYFEAALGIWTTKPYCVEKTYNQEIDPVLCKIGTWYTVLFLMINLVLLLNLVIALLSSIYNFY